MVAWDEVCRPKGGIGIRKNDDINKALITKLGQRIFRDSDNIWANIMRDKYAKNNDFFRITKKGDSLVWKEILNHREYFGVGLK